MGKMKNQLDERQEQKMLRIEHNGCWFAFWALAAALVIQMLLFKDAWEHMAGEYIIFMCLGVYILAASIKNGIWDRRFAPSQKVNFIISSVCGIFAGIIFFVIKYIEYRTFAGAFASGLVIFFLVLIGGNVVSALCLAEYHKRIERMENPGEEEE